MSAQQVTVSGNVTAAPELAFGKTGQARCTFTVACQDRYRDNTGAFQDGDTYFARCVAWGQLAERIGASIGKGDRVIVQGSFVTHSWDKDDGTKGYATDLRVEDCGASMLWAECTVRRVRGSRREAAPAEVESSGDPWATPAQESQPVPF